MNISKRNHNLIIDDNSEVIIKNLEEKNELLLLQLHQVQEELERYFLELKSIKSGNFSNVGSFSYPQYRDSTPRGPYGAAGFHGEPLATRDIDVFCYLDVPDQIDNQSYEKYLLNQTNFDQALPESLNYAGEEVVS